MKAQLEELELEVASWASSVAAGSNPFAAPRIVSSFELLSLQFPFCK